MVEKAGFRGVLQAYRYCIPVGCCGGRLLMGKGLDGFYRITNVFLDFVLGILGWICRRMGRRFGGLPAFGGGCGVEGTAAGEAGFLDGVGQDEEQEPDHLSDGGVVLGGDFASLAVEFGADGYGDVSWGWHGVVVPIRGLDLGTGCGGVAAEASPSSSVRRRGVIFGKAGWRGRGASGFW